MTYSVAISAAGAEPVSVGQVRAHTRIDDTASDALILDYIASARAWVETYTGLLLRSCTATFVFPCLNSLIILPRGPISAITSISYQDTDNASQTLSASLYVLQQWLNEYQVVRTYGASYPSIYPESLVTVTASAGYTMNTIPDDLRTVLYRMVAHLYDMRGEDGGLGGFTDQLVNHKLTYI